MTTRDFEIIDFVKEFKVADTDTITELFFPSLSACQKRLKVIYDNNQLDRCRDNLNCSYIYYHKLPKQLRHSLIVSRFYCKLSKLCKIKRFVIEQKYDMVKPDASFVYEINGISKVGVLEVELSNKGFDWGKYERFISNDFYKKFMTIPPTLFIVSDKTKKRSNFCLNYDVFNTNLANLRAF